MPSWGVHLGIANKVLKNIDNIDKNLFMFGNVTPDINNGYVIKNVSKIIAHKITHYDGEKEHTQYKKHTQGFFRAGGSQKEPYIPYETGVHIQRGDNRDGPAVRLQGGERRDEQDTGCQRRGRVRAFQGGTAGHAV